MKSSNSTILSIDTAQSSVTKVGITCNEHKKEYLLKTDSHRSQNLLPLIIDSLQKESLSFSDITEIEVSCGPGSFTGTRVGVSIANALGWALHIPVNGKSIAVPQYRSSKFD